MKVKDLIALIESDGWHQVRQKGSHRQFHHPSKSGTATVSEAQCGCPAWNAQQRFEASWS